LNQTDGEFHLCTFLLARFSCLTAVPERLALTRARYSVIVSVLGCHLSA